MVEKKCSTCVHHKRFKPRPDEPTDIGCYKRNWEGYTSDEHPYCGLVFWSPIEKKLKLEKTHEE